RPREIQLWEHRREKPAQSLDIALAVTQESHPLGLAPGFAPHGQFLEALFLGPLQSVEAMPGHRSQETGSVPARRAVSPVPEFDKQVKGSSREPPTEGQETTQLGRSVIGHEKRIGADRDRRLPSAPQLILPELENLARAILAKDRTNRERRVSRPG